MMHALQILLSALYVFLPAYCANMAPVIAGGLQLPGAVPIASKALGAHKTYRGLIAGYAAALLMLWMQRLLQEEGMLESMRLLDYSATSLLFAALLFAGGALGGDLVKSFFKRRLGKAPGAAWFPWDQWDFVLGTFLLVLPFHPLPWEVVLTIIILTPLLHLLANVTGYLIGWKKVWW